MAEVGWSVFCGRGDSRLCAFLGMRCTNPAHRTAAPKAPHQPRPLRPRRERQPRHGTYTEYCTRGCRCPACREAWRLYQIDYRRARGVRPAEEVWAEQRTGRTHGIRTTYTKGCRCEDCKRAEREYRARYRRRAA